MELIDAIARNQDTEQPELIEKDIVLHEILCHLSHMKYFTQNYLFKGGTCLMKAHIGYVRFSGDLDFTWRDQSAYNDKTSNGIKKFVSKEIEMLAKMLAGIADKSGLDFKFEKQNERYFIYGGSGKMLAMNIWYTSEIKNTEEFIKIQINFLETMCYPPQKKNLSSLVLGNKELKPLFIGNKYFEKISFNVYDPHEILCEKIRAILTRTAIKARDFIDVYFICNFFKIDLCDIQENSMKKLHYSLNLYVKYRINLSRTTEQLKSRDLFDWKYEQYILLQKVGDEFLSFNDDLESFLWDSILGMSDNSLDEITTICLECFNQSSVPNPEQKQFDQINLKHARCSKCKKENTLKARSNCYSNYVH